MKRLLLVLAACLVTGTTFAQPLQSPAEFLGYRLGERFTPHHRVQAYLQHVAGVSDRVQLEPYGTTYEGRELVLAYLSSPANLARLESIQVDNLRRAGLEPGAPEGERTAIVWLSYNVHGNESVSTEAALQTLYDLARTDAPERAGWLDRTVVILDSCINPDGRERYVNGYNQRLGVFPDADPLAIEHEENWPGGRPNHYLFDLNRDWAWLSQRESRLRIERYNQWMPQVHVDFHEQGVDSPYYFAPAVEPYHSVITDWQREFQRTIGEANARVFDRNGWLYFTRESFDLLYPSYGDTYAAFNGAIGMTYEQAGSGRAGLGIETAEGDTLTLADRIAHHHATGMATVETAVQHRERLVEEFERYFAVSARNSTDVHLSFVLGRASGADRLGALAAHLDALGISYGTVSATRKARGSDYRTGATGPVSVEPGDLVVSVRQPRGRMARVLFEPDADLSDSLTYDITAWALPYAYGLEGAALLEHVAPDAPFVRKAVDVVAAPVPEVYAWAIPWTSPEDARFLARLLRDQVAVRVATEPFTSGGRSFERGTLLVTRAGNALVGDRLNDLVSTAAAAHGRRPVALASGLVQEGRDFGSESVRLVTPPRVLIAFGEGVSTGSAGEVWHWFDERMAYPSTRISVESLASADLGDWDVIVLPSGSYGALVEGNGLDRLRSWIAAGNRLILLDSAVRLLADQEGFGLKSADSEDDAKKDSLRTYADRIRSGAAEDVAGAVFETRVDATHPLGFGLERGFYTLKRSSGSWPYLDSDRAWNVGTIAVDAHRSGFVGSKAGEKVDQTLAFGVQEVGRGAVVYLPEGPLFRAFWYEGQLLFANAVFMPLR